MQSINTIDSVQFELPTDDVSLDVLNTCLSQMLARLHYLSDPEETIQTVQTAVHTTCTSIANLAYANQPTGRIASTLILDSTTRCLVVELCDAGKPCDIHCATPVDTLHLAGQGTRQSHALLHTLSTLMDEVSYSPEPGKNCWRLVKYLT